MPVTQSDNRETPRTTGACAVSVQQPQQVWWRFRRADGAPWGIAGLWNTWTNKDTGELIPSYTMLTINADAHPLMRRMHKPDHNLPPNRQDKRSLVAIELEDVDRWLYAPIEEAVELVRLTPPEMMEAGPAEQVPAQRF